MIASQQMNWLGVVELIGEEESDNFDAKGAPVDVVAKKEVLLGGGCSVFVEDVE